jgi:hypothetical protein
VPSSPLDDGSGLPTAASGDNISPERPVIRWMSVKSICEVSPKEARLGTAGVMSGQLRQAARIHQHNLVVEARKTALIFGDQLKLRGRLTSVDSKRQIDPVKRLGRDAMRWTARTERLLSGVGRSAKPEEGMSLYLGRSAQGI